MYGSNERVNKDHTALLIRMIKNNLYILEQYVTCEMQRRKKPQRKVRRIVALCSTRNSSFFYIYSRNVRKELYDSIQLDSTTPSILICISSPENTSGNRKAYAILRNLVQVS